MKILTVDTVISIPIRFIKWAIILFIFWLINCNLHKIITNILLVKNPCWFHMIYGLRMWYVPFIFQNKNKKSSSKIYLTGHHYKRCWEKIMSKDLPWGADKCNVKTHWRCRCQICRMQIPLLVRKLFEICFTFFTKSSVTNKSITNYLHRVNFIQRKFFKMIKCFIWIFIIYSQSPSINITFNPSQHNINFNINIVKLLAKAKLAFS